MTASQVLWNKRLALGLYIAGNMIVAWQPYTMASGLLSNVQYGLHLSDTLTPALCLIVVCPAIYFTALYLTKHRVIPSQIVSAKTLSFLVFPMLSICWILFGSILLPLQSVSYSSLYVIRTETVKNGWTHSLEMPFYDYMEESSTPISMSVYVIWFWTLLWSCILMGVSIGSLSFLQKRVNLRYKDALTREQLLESKSSEKTSHQVDLEGRTSELALTTEDDLRKQLASSRLDMVLGVLSVIFGLCHLWILHKTRSFEPAWPISSWTVSIWPLGLVELAPDFLAYSFVPGMVIILIGKRVLSDM